MIQTIYESSAPVPGPAIDPRSEEFLRDVRLLIHESIRDGGGVPITSRAKDFTALVALNFFLFFLVAIESAAHLRNIGIMQ